MQLDTELMDLIRDRDTRVMYKVLFGAFKKRNLKSLDNQQMEKLIELLKKEYDVERNPPRAL
jgi:hypothetical protein